MVTISRYRWADARFGRSSQNLSRCSNANNTCLGMAIELGLTTRLTISSFMSDNIMPLSQAVEGYELFDKMKVQKGM